MTETIQWGSGTSLIDHRIEAMPDYLFDSPIGTDFAKSRLEMALRQLPTGVLMVVKEEFADLDLTDMALQANAYTIPKLAEGRQESKWAVKFGELVLNSKEQGERTELVALKQMPAVRAAREFHAAEHIAFALFDRQDRRATFETLGFYKDAHTKQINWITRYEHGVNSTDNILWNRNEVPSASQVKYSLMRAADTLADLHGQALVGHGDPQPKNIASDLRGRRVIDLEDAIDLRGPSGEVDTMKAPLIIENDLHMYLAKTNYTDAQLVNEHFAEHYLERLKMHDELPSFVHPTIKKIGEIAARPQEPIPYLT